MRSMVEAIHEEWIRGLVQKQIFCPITGHVLDYRTCAVVRDADGDPVGVYDPAVLKALSPVLEKSLAEKGLSITPNPRADG